MPVFHCSSVGHPEHIKPGYGASDVDQGIDAAKAIQRLFHDDLGRRGCHQVEFEHERFGADRFGQLANLTQFPSAMSRKDDSSEIASQPKSRGLPDTRACACYDRDRSRHILLVRF
jgi:hypothetical protein